MSKPPPRPFAAAGEWPPPPAPPGAAYVPPPLPPGDYLPVSQPAVQPAYSFALPSATAPPPPPGGYEYGVYSSGAGIGAGGAGGGSALRGFGAPLLVPAPAAAAAAPGYGGGLFYGGAPQVVVVGGGVGYAPAPGAAMPVAGGGAPAGYDDGGGYYGGYGMGTDMLYATRAMRHAFLQKVLGIVAAQLILTAAVAAPVVLLPGAPVWLAQNAWAVPAAVVVTFATLLILVCSESARRTHPTNLLLLGLFTAAQGLLVGVACAAYSAPTVVLAVVMSAVVCLSLVGYALQTKYDFTASGGMLYTALWVLLLVTLLNGAFGVRMPDLLVAGSGALVFCCYVVYDVQLIASGDSAAAISVDEPVAAALNVYVDIINVFLFVLRLVGRDED